MRNKCNLILESHLGIFSTHTRHKNSFNQKKCKSFYYYSCVCSNESESEYENGMKFHPLQYSTAIVSPFATSFISVWSSLGVVVAERWEMRSLFDVGGWKIHRWMTSNREKKRNFVRRKTLSANWTNISNWQWPKSTHTLNYQQIYNVSAKQTFFSHFSHPLSDFYLFSHSLSLREMWCWHLKNASKQKSQ
jgi:hypothetical protein